MNLNPSKKIAIFDLVFNMTWCSTSNFSAEALASLIMSSQSRPSGDDRKLINLAASQVNFRCFGSHNSTVFPS